MALKATVFKVELQVSDLDRIYYQTHSLTLARHPSETDERMMIRLLAFALNASEHLHFTKGLSTEAEPDLWQKNLQGEIELWIEVGVTDAKRIRKGSNRAKQAIIYAYGARTAPVWWESIQGDLARFDNLTISYLSPENTAALAGLANRNMTLQATLQDGLIWIGNSEQTLTITPEYWQRARLSS